MGQVCGCLSATRSEAVPVCIVCRRRGPAPWGELLPFEKERWVRRVGGLSCMACAIQQQQQRQKGLDAFCRERVQYARIKNMLYPRTTAGVRPLKRLSSGQEWDDSASFCEAWRPPSSLKRLLSAIWQAQQDDPSKHQGVQRAPPGFVPAEAAAASALCGSRDIDDGGDSDGGSSGDGTLEVPTPAAAPAAQPRLPQRPPASWASPDAAAPVPAAAVAAAPVADAREQAQSGPLPMGRLGSETRARWQEQQRQRREQRRRRGEQPQVEPQPQQEGRALRKATLTSEQLAAQMAELEGLPSVQLVEELPLDSCFIHTPPLPLLRAAAVEKGDAEEAREAAGGGRAATAAAGSVCSSRERCGQQQRRRQERWRPEKQHGPRTQHGPGGQQACGGGTADTPISAAEGSGGGGWVPITP